MKPRITRNALTILALAACLGCLGTLPASAGTVRHVATTGADVGDCVAAPCRTIGHAITQSVSGDTISVAAGTYAEHVLIDRSLTLTGGGSSSTFIDGSSSGTVVTIGSLSASITVTITRVTIQNGYAQIGGGISSVPGTGHTNQITLSRSAVVANEALGPFYAVGLGGGIYNAAGSTLTITKSTVANNSASG